MHSGEEMEILDEYGPSCNLEAYNKYVKRKIFIIFLTVILLVLFSGYAINAGSANVTVSNIITALMGNADDRINIIIWDIRLPRILAAVIAGVGLSMAGCVMQSILKNPLTSPFTLGISQGATFGAALAIVAFGAGAATSDFVAIDNPYIVVVFAFLGSMASTIVVLMLAKNFKATPETLVLSGVALSSLFSAVTMLLQYFADDVRVASIVFWTFGDLGRASWSDLMLMSIIVAVFAVYFMINRWNYNAMESGEESAKGVDALDGSPLLDIKPYSYLIAHPDGKLINQKDGKEYSYLFWEGNSNIEYDMDKGFVVKGEDTAEFLRDKLEYIGLTPREYNEFIVYWLPKMQNNPYNLITFQNEVYTDNAKLEIVLEPDSILRVFMVYKPIKEVITIEEQTLEPFQRQGFTVVEWGGTVVN
jgi:ABC-type Fe3+-siderophore transport system permease subunit